MELLKRTSVTALDLQARTAKLSNKQEIEFDKALIATGANVRRLNVDGCHLEQIHYLRTLGNADAIRDGVADAENVVLIGGSYIGCEVAASLTMLGKRLHDRDAGAAHAGTWLRQAGRQLLSGAPAIARRDDSRQTTSSSASRATSRVAKVITRDGLELAADAVVIGAGVTPDVQLAQRAGLQIGERGGVTLLLTPAELDAGGVRGRRHLRIRVGRARRRCTCASSTGTWPSTTARRPR